MREITTEPGEIRHLPYIRQGAKTGSPDSVILAVPWPIGSGRIPPPEIIFYTSNGPISYIYGGSND